MGKRGVREQNRTYFLRTPRGLGRSPECGQRIFQPLRRAVRNCRSAAPAERTRASVTQPSRASARSSKPLRTAGPTPLPLRPADHTRAAEGGDKVWDRFGDKSHIKGLKSRNNPIKTINWNSASETNSERGLTAQRPRVAAAGRAKQRGARTGQKNGPRDGADRREGPTVQLRAGA